MQPRPRTGHGRQAEARRNDLAVLEAARDVFTALGADAPVSAVAERAGVGMGTLYRRYGSKTELLQRLCVLSMEQAVRAAEEALAADDPWAGLAGYVRACVELRSGALASLAGQIEVTAEMRRTAERGMTLTARVAERAHRDGSLRRDATAMDITWLIEQFSRRSPARADQDSERDVRARLLAIALDGLRAGPAGRPADTLPGDPPSRSQYADRWKRAASGIGSPATTASPAIRADRLPGRLNWKYAVWLLPSSRPSSTRVFQPMPPSSRFMHTMRTLTVEPLALSAHTAQTTQVGLCDYLHRCCDL